jgi:rhamnogalacturonyl hydrolase YesR
MVYTETFSLWSRTRLGEAAAVRAILEPYLSGQHDSLERATASHYSGHLALIGLEDPRAEALLKRAAAMAAERPLDNEMSDSVFMVCPLLTRAGMADGAADHFERMERICRRPDGLWRHSPLCEAAWGRGNAFPLTGLALTLLWMPKGHPRRGKLLAAFQALGRTLLRHQQADGMWRQVIDHGAAWAEYSATAMITAALGIGRRDGWLEGSGVTRAIGRGWRAIAARTGANGEIGGVCESTGKQTSLEAYLARRAITGLDSRGGAMGLFLAAEMAGAAEL